MCQKHSGLPHVTILLVLIDYTWLVEESQSATKKQRPCFSLLFLQACQKSPANPALVAIMDQLFSGFDARSPAGGTFVVLVYSTLEEHSFSV